MRDRPRKLSEQVVVIMGASSGIGREAALRFADQGAKVVVAARGEAKLRSLVQEIETAGGTAVCAPCDVTDREQVRAVCRLAVERFGRIDTWVHCSGVGLWADFDASPAAEWDRVIEVNLIGLANGARAALPYLRESRGALVAVTSSDGPVALPYQSAYGASKAGAHALLRSLRLELERDGVDVRVTEVMPSGINTPIFDQARTRIGVKPRPPGPMYQPNVVVNALEYAAEHRARQIPVGSAARAAMLGQAVSGPMMDQLIRLGGTAMQRTDEPKAAEAPANLFQPVDVEQRIEADLPARSWSGYTWLITHPNAARLAGAAVLGSLAALFFRKRGSS